MSGEATASTGSSGVDQPRGSTLFDSDVYTSYTAWYAWRSNQCGHAGLGCIVSLAAITFVPWFDEHRWALFAFYPFKEAFDFWRAVKVNKGPFPVPWRVILADCVTDTLFVWLGVFITYLVPLSLWDIAVIAIAIAVVLAIALPYWRPSKRGFDKSGLPYLFRLATFYPANWEAAKAPIRDFLNQKGVGHLVLFGPHESGKTSLAVGIGCEAIEAGKNVRYLSACRLLEELSAPQRPDPDEPWTVDEADVLIVDDVVEVAALTSLANRLAGGQRCVWGISSLAGTREVSPELQAMPFAAVNVGAMNYSWRRPRRGERRASTQSPALAPDANG